MDKNFKTFECQLRAVAPDDPDSPYGAIVEGMFTTDDIDRYGEIVESAAFTGTMSAYMKNPMLLLNHNFDHIIGQVMEYEIRAHGVWIKAGIQKLTQLGRDVSALAKAGIVRSYSFMFKPVKWVKTENNNEPLRYTEVELYEVSIVAVPANPNALIENARAAGITLETKDISNIFQGKEIAMSDAPNLNLQFTEIEKKVDALTGGLSRTEGAIADAQKSVRSVQERIDSYNEIVKAVQKKGEDLAAGTITKADFKEFCDKLKGDMDGLVKEVENAKLAADAKKSQLPFSDWRSAIGAGKYEWLTYDNGRPMPEIHQKAYHYFQSPVDYKQSEGEYLKKMRDLYDCVLFSYQYNRGKGLRSNVTNLKSFQLLRDMMEKVDSEFAKAMYSTGTGLGDEWVPTLMSSELQDLIRMQPALENYLPQFTMPGNPYVWPIKTSGATAYIASEASVANPAELHSSDIGTSNVTFTADTHAVMVLTSPELIEDAIVDMVGEIRKEIAFALTDGMENALINGDTTATHRDTATVTATDDIARAFMGLRFLAIDLSKTFDTQSTSVGDATTAFAAKDVRYTRQLLGVMGINPKEVLYCVPIDVFFYMLSMSEFAKANEFGYTSTWYSGDLPVADGCQIYISPKFPATMGTAGLCDSASTYKGILALNRERGFKIGMKRGITLEFDKNIRTQQWAFVATRRADFQNMQPSTRYPVAYGYKIA